MDPTVAPPQRLSSATLNHLHSNDFSPRSRNTDSWGEDNSIYPSNHGSSAAAAAAVGSVKLRLMCSSGGHIVPRPHDKTLCYVGGETRMVVVDRHTTLLDLTNRLSKTLLRSSSSSTPTPMASTSFTLKYQLPSEDLDSLISVTTDEDLENMIEEYERLNSSSAGSKSSRLRLFLFPTKLESVSSITSFLENTTKSEDWFLSALNGTDSGFSDTSSVNYLLGLDDEISLHEKKDVNHKSAIATNLRGNNSGQDVHSIPDSPMMETTSSFGSASSTPSLPNLPPIQLNVDDHPKVVGGGIEEQFSQMTVQQRHHKQQNDAGFIPAATPVVVSGSPMISATAIPEQSDPFSSYQGLHRAYQKDEQQFQQKQSTGFDFASSDSVLSDQLTPILKIQSSGNTNRSTDQNETPDQNTRIQIQQQQIQNSPYLLSMPTTQQLQFIHTAAPPPQYIHHHHHPSPAVVPVAPYYQMYQSQGHHHPQNPAMGQQNFVYLMPHQGYNFPLQQQQQPSDSDSPRKNQAAPKTEFPAGVYRRTNSGTPQLMRVPSGNQYGGGGNYAYEGQQLQQHIYYGKQAMPPQTAAQYQTITSTAEP
ncbi:uncharacterized protein LOC111911259 [Lactuca sativa]|nr:uncharacterized protein LOC111911259 [Lactuca sativa]